MMTTYAIKATLFTLTALLALTACAPNVSHPPVAEIDPIIRPNVAPIPALMAGAIKYARDHYEGPREVIINLPPDTPAFVYGKVIDRIGPARPMTSPDQLAYHVTSVRVRGNTAYVDLIYPRQGGTYEFVTLTYRRKGFSDYSVDHTRFWRIPADIPPPNYIPPEQEDRVSPTYRPMQPGDG